MHYEEDESYFVLPNELIQNVDMLGEANEKEIFSLPEEDVNENQVFERGKKF